MRLEIVPDRISRYFPPIQQKLLLLYNEFEIYYKIFTIQYHSEVERGNFRNTISDR